MQNLKSALFAFFLFPALSYAQKADETKAIKNLCGCFEVQFMYAETFSPDPSYSPKDQYKAHGLEWVLTLESSPQKYVLQHLLIVDDTDIVKHWREDWEYQKNSWLQFVNPHTWKRIQKDPDTVTGQWTQTVWEVDDSPRYQGSGFWVRNDNKLYWENTTDAPLPRREYSKRSDYNVMKRTNRIIYTDSGWVHEQDNQKTIRENDKADRLLVQEKGYNIYKRVPDSRCASAQSWWTQHHLFWDNVRKGWEIVLNQSPTVHLQLKIKSLSIADRLDSLEKKSARKEEIIQTLNEYLH